MDVDFDYTKNENQFSCNEIRTMNFKHVSIKRKPRD